MWGGNFMVQIGLRYDVGRIFAFDRRKLYGFISQVNVCVVRVTSLQKDNFGD